MNIFIKTTLVLVLLAIFALIGFSYHISRPLFQQQLSAQALASPAIAPPEQALTFARSAGQLLLVSSSEAQTIEAIDLSVLYNSTDLIALYNSHGYEHFWALLQQDLPRITVAIEQLQAPLSYSTANIAAGTNYAEHAEEVYLDDPPFLFPKLSAATNWNAAVTALGSRRLDFEAELCMVPLQDIRVSASEMQLGLILCNDFTDRWTLLKQLDFAMPMGQTGFAAAKGKPTFLPTGYFLLIPKSATFYETLELELYVNKQMRQKFRAGDMILKPADIIHQAFEQTGTTFYDGDQPVMLMPEGHIPSGTIILTGTAAGVMFKPANIWNSGFYLHSGDRVITRATYLGHLDNSIH
jgi:2,4-diketo-3-deoxy-L-fuconate hydrolase